MSGSLPLASRVFLSWNGMIWAMDFCVVPTHVRGYILGSGLPVVYLQHRGISSMYALILLCTDSFLSFFFFFLTLFYFTILYWFCHTLTWIHHGCFLLLLKYNCFTMLYLFLLYNEVNQLYVCTHPLPLGSSSHTPHHPTLLGITEHWASFLHYRAAPL